MNELQKIQEWYLSQCNEDWEHSYGIEIGTLDNPGWLMKIDLRDTDLDGQEFDPVFRGNPEEDTDWMHCEVKEYKFQGACGAKNLSELFQVFLKWVT